MTDPVDFIPAGRPWLGKRARGPVLTDAFVRSAVRGGSIIPPQDGVEPALWRGVRAALIITAICGMTMWSIIHFWPV